MTAPVYLVDDDAAVRKAIALLLETVGMRVTTFDGPEPFLRQLVNLAPGCLLLDMRMPVISGLRLQEKLRDAGTDWPTIIISGHGDIDACRRAFRNGAVDFLSKPVDEQDLIDAIQRAQAVLVQRLQQGAERAEAARLLAALTQRERDILDYVARGFATRQIAEALDISPRTVETHRAALAAKLGTTSVAELTRLWLSRLPTAP